MSIFNRKKDWDNEPETKAIRNLERDKLNENEFNNFKNKHAYCFSCGVFCKVFKMNPLAVLKKDIPEEEVERVYSDYSMLIGASWPYYEASSKQEESKTLYFCKHCPVKYPEKPKKEIK